MCVQKEAENFKQLFSLIGQRITHFRKSKQMTLEHLGFEIGLDKSAMHHIEKGKPITMTTFFKIAKALEIKPEVLLLEFQLPNGQDLLD